MRKKGDKDKFKNKRVHFKDDYEIKGSLPHGPKLETSHSSRNLINNLDLNKNEISKPPLKVKTMTENVGKISTASTTTINILSTPRSCALKYTSYIKHAPYK